jgi:hypothetical protein
MRPDRTPSGWRNAMTTLDYRDFAQSSVFEQVAATTVCCGPAVLGTRICNRRRKAARLAQPTLHLAQKD